MTDVGDCGGQNPKSHSVRAADHGSRLGRGALSIRETQQSFASEQRPACTTVQTRVYRLEGKRVVHRLKKISNAHIFEPLVSRQAAQRRLIVDSLALFGGKAHPVMAQLIETGKLSLKDIEDAESTLRRLAKQGKQP